MEAIMIPSKRIFRPAIALAVTLLALPSLASSTSNSTVTVFSKSSTKTNATTLTGVKWHPGHYVLVYDTTSDSSIPSIVSALGVSFRGIQRNYHWNDIEPTYGQYNFSKIQQDLNTVGRYGKRLIVAIQGETFNQPGVSIVPSYLLTSQYGGGVYTTTSGTNIAYYNTAVQGRLYALYQALGNTFDSNPNLEAITLPETAPSAPNASTWNPLYLNDYILGMTNVALSAKSSLPHTNVIQYINYPTSIISTMIATLKAAAIGVGGPDVLVEDTGLINGSYPYIKGVANQVPIGMAVQYEDYSAKYHNGPYDPPGIASLYQFSQSQLQSNYVFWLRRTAESATAANGYHASNYYQDLLDYMATINWTNNPAGGLSTACPILIGTCTN
jgi:hypothetical protein